MSAAIAGSDVVITVESMFSMNSAQATISGMRTAGRTAQRSGVSVAVAGAGEGAGRDARVARATIAP